MFSDDAKEAVVYEKLDYDGVSRNPNEYWGKNVTFTGKILQVYKDEDLIQIEEEGESGIKLRGKYTYYYRIATKGNYDNVVLCTESFVYGTSEYDYRKAHLLLEGDKVIVKGWYADLTTYTSTIGKEVTVPKIYIDSIELK